MNECKWERSKKLWTYRQPHFINEEQRMQENTLPFISCFVIF